MNALQRWLPLAVLALITSGCASTQVFPTPEARQALTPTGKLRVAINLGNPALAKRDAASGQVSGITLDLGRALASRLEADFVPVLYPDAGALLDAAKAGAWDLGFVAIDPARADTLEFTAPYMEVGDTLHAIAVPRGRRPGLGFAAAFVEELKSSGAVAESIKRHAIRGVDVAPSAKGRAAAGR